MSLSASTQCATQKRTLSCLLSGRAGKRPRQEDAQRLQEAAVQLLHRHQNLSDLLLEVGSPNPCNVLDQEKSGQREAPTEGPTPAIEGSFLVSELRRQAGELGVAVASLSVRMVLDRLLELTASRPEEETAREAVLLNHTQRVHLSVLLRSTRELLSLGAFCSRLFWQQYWEGQKQVRLEVVYHLHSLNIVSLEYVLESDEGTQPWLVSELKALCGGTAAQEEEEEVRRKILSVVLGVLVRSGFQEEAWEEPAGPGRKISPVCRSALDDLLSWVLDASGPKGTSRSSDPAADLWVQMFDASLCGDSLSPESLRRFFTHSLTHTLTYRPRLKVADAIAMQRDWSFAKSCRLLTSLFRKLTVVLGVEELLSHLRQVLETHEVNWQHVLSFLSTLLVFNPHAHPSLQELLSRLLRSAFEGYDLESLITAFLLARQGALEGPGLFSSYSDWFKMAFGRASGYHSNSKKSLVFLLKFLSDLVPFDPPQYLKVHVLHPPYVAVKHRSLLQEYVSLARTRLADLKVSMEDMGLYEDVSGAGAPVQWQACQDVEKAVSLFENTRKISATVMEASIFRRPYFLSRFLPALLSPRVLPVKADAQMGFIDALRKADKIPAAQYSCYVESCQKERQRQREGGGVVVCEQDEDPQEFLRTQLQVFRGLVTQEDDGEVSAQLARISHTLGVIFPHCPDSLIGQTVVKLHVDTPTSPELHVKVVNMLLRNFCQCLLDANRVNPPNSQSPWASRYVSCLLGNTQLLTALLLRLWDLLHNQGPSLSAAHVLGLGAFVSHLHACQSQSQCPLVQLCPALLPGPVPVSEALSSALPCNTHTNMLFCVRLCVAAVSYGLCRGDPQSDQQQYTPTWFCKKLLYLVPRLLPEARLSPPSEAWPRGSGGPGGSGGARATGQEQDQWRSVTDTGAPWRTAAWTLWNHSPFRLTLQLPECQLSFSEWLNMELRVQRSEDALSEPERQEYQQWACQQLYLCRPVPQGGCGGDMKTLCSLLLSAILDQQTPGGRPAETGSCLPDLLSRLQEVVYEMELTGQSRGSKGQRGHFLLELLSQRCPLTSDPQPISSQLSLQQSLHAWNRVLLSLPAVLLVTVRTEGGRAGLDCQTLIEHVNLHQRKVCSPAGLLPYHLTAHLLKGVLSASVRCECPSREVNEAWSQISLRCPLLLVSTAHWWGRLSGMLESLWGRLTDREPLPEQMRLLAACHVWACSVEEGVSTSAPSAPPLLLAANLHAAWAGHGRDQNIRTGLEMSGLGREQREQVLVYLLFLTVTDVLTALLDPPEVKGHQRALELCTHILSLLVHSSDWLLLFKASGPGLYSSVAMVTSEEHRRLLPVAFYSLVLQLSPADRARTGRCAGFLHTAALCYTALISLFLDGHAPQPITELAADQSDLSLTLRGAQQLLLRTISLSSPSTLSSSQLSQLEALCSEVDPEVAAALSTHLNPDSLSQEMDFL